jgi:hypothetical protein
MPALNDLTSQHTASSRFQRLRLGVVVLGVLVILAFAASSAYDGWRAYGNALSATEREIVNESNTLAEQTAWTTVSGWPPSTSMRCWRIAFRGCDRSVS